MALAHQAAIRLSACCTDGSERKQPRHREHWAFAQAKISARRIWSCCLASLGLDLFCVIKTIASAAVCSMAGIFATFIMSLHSLNGICVYSSMCKKFSKTWADCLASAKCLLQ